MNYEKSWHFDYSFYLFFHILLNDNELMPWLQGLHLNPLTLIWIGPQYAVNVIQSPAKISKLGKSPALYLMYKLEGLLQINTVLKMTLSIFIVHVSCQRKLIFLSFTIKEKNHINLCALDSICQIEVYGTMWRLWNKIPWNRKWLNNLSIIFNITLFYCIIIKGRIFHASFYPIHL